VILVVIFDERSSLGLVRLRVKQGEAELDDVFARIMSKVEEEHTAAGAARAPSPRSPTTTSTASSVSPASDELHQLRLPRDQLQDRLLRSRSVREDDQPAVHLRQDEPQRQGQADLARHRDRPHPVLRLPAPRPRHGARASRPASTSTPCPARSSTTRAASSSSRASTASSSWPTPGRAHGRQRRVPRQPRGQPARGLRPDDDPLRPAAQQARPAERGPGRRDGAASCARRASRCSRRWPPRGPACSRR
jgi:hypothetical protein